MTAENDMKVAPLYPKSSWRVDLRRRRPIADLCRPERGIKLRGHNL